MTSQPTPDPTAAPNDPGNPVDPLPTNPPKGTRGPTKPPPAGDTTLTGTVQAGVEPNCLLLDGYLLIGGPRDVLKPGARVTVTGRVPAGHDDHLPAGHALRGGERPPGLRPDHDAGARPGTGDGLLSSYRARSADALHDHVAAADENVRVGPDLDVAVAAPGRRPARRCAVTVPGTVHDAPLGRGALASVTDTEPKAALVKTSM